MKYYINVFLASLLSILIFILIIKDPTKEVQFIEGGNIIQSQTIDSLIYLTDSLKFELSKCSLYHD
jgi:hypothetical protein